MPLLETAASVTAKGYGFGVSPGASSSDALVFVLGSQAQASVRPVTVDSMGDVSVNLTGVQSAASVGSVTISIPQPVPDNQYWAAVSKATSGSVPQVVTYSVDVFRFTETPSPAITSVSSGTVLGTVYPEQFVSNVYPQIASTNNGRTYVALGYDDTTGPVTPSRVVSFDLSTGSAPIVTTAVSLSYETSGTERFRNLIDISARRDGTALGLIYTYLNTSGQVNYAFQVGDINTDGTGYSVSRTYFQTPSLFSYNKIAINPVYDEFFMVNGTQLSDGFGRMELYKTTGSTSAIQSTSSSSVATSIVWSNSGLYLARTGNTASTGFILFLEFDPNASSSPYFSTIPTLVQVPLNTTVVGWTADDSAMILSNGWSVVVTGGDPWATFGTTTTIPGVNGQPAFNYNDSYLFSASFGQTSSENVKVFERTGTGLVTTPVISLNNSNKEYRANAAYPRFNGEA